MYRNDTYMSVFVFKRSFFWYHVWFCEMYVKQFTLHKVYHHDPRFYMSLMIKCNLEENAFTYRNDTYMSVFVFKISFFWYPVRFCEMYVKQLKLHKVYHHDPRFYM